MFNIINIWDGIRPLALILWKVLSLFSKTFPVKLYESIILQVWKRCVLRYDFTLRTFILRLISFWNFHFLHEDFWWFKLHVFVNVFYAVWTFIKNFTRIFIFLIEIRLLVSITNSVLRWEFFEFLDFHTVIEFWLIGHGTRSLLPVKYKLYLLNILI